MGKPLTVKPHLIDNVYMSVCETEMLADGKAFLVKKFPICKSLQFNRAFWDISNYKLTSTVEVYNFLRSVFLKNFDFYGSIVI